MIKTTLCYIEKNCSYLMLHRTMKKNDINEGKWIGIGGKFLPGETSEECLLREAREETGLILSDYEFKGIVTFVSDIYETEEMHLYLCKGFSGNLIHCDEGELKWIDKSEILNLPLWEGDRIFLEYLFENKPFFELRLEYQGDKLISAKTQYSHLSPPF